MTASPISDLNPLFLALQCQLHVAELTENGNRVERDILMDENFFVGYRKTCLKPGEVICSLAIPYTTDVSPIDNLMITTGYERNFHFRMSLSSAINKVLGAKMI